MSKLYWLKRSYIDELDFLHSISLLYLTCVCDFNFVFSMIQEISSNPQLTTGLMLSHHIHLTTINHLTHFHSILFLNSKVPDMEVCIKSTLNEFIHIIFSLRPDITFGRVQMPMSRCNARCSYMTSSRGRLKLPLIIAV